MTAKTCPKVLRKARDMIRAGYTDPEIAKACGISVGPVRKQAALIARFEGRVDRSANQQKAVSRTRANIAQGKDYDPELLDLVEIFDTPRTPSQLRRFAERD